MKKCSIFLLAALFLFTFSSCEDAPEGEWDFKSVVLNVSIVDKDGNSLLSTEYENNIVGSRISFTEGDSIYEVDWNASRMPASRYYFAPFYGARYLPVLKWNGEHWDDSDEYHIELGEFAGDSNYDRTFNIEIKGQKFELRVFNKLNWKGNDPVIKRHFFLNGVEQEDSNFKLVVKSAL